MNTIVYTEQALEDAIIKINKIVSNLYAYSEIQNAHYYVLESSLANESMMKILCAEANIEPSPFWLSNAEKLVPTNMLPACRKMRYVRNNAAHNFEFEITPEIFEEYKSCFDFFCSWFFTNSKTYKKYPEHIRPHLPWHN